jgi:hypothetical protein
MKNNNILSIILGGLVLILTTMYFANHQDDLGLLKPTASTGNHSTLICHVLDCGGSQN